MKIIIVEDEKYTADLIIRLVRQYDPEIEIVKVLSNVEESVKWFSQPVDFADLILMDVHLTDGVSFEIFEQVTVETPVIFITAYNEYAIQAFRVNSIDYLLKPFNYSDLERALDKYTKLKSTISVGGAQWYKGLFPDGVRPYKSRFLVKVGENYHFLQTSTIACFHYAEGIVSARLFNGNQQIIDETLEELEGVLDPLKFYRLNRRIIVSIDAINRIQNYFNRRLSVHLLPDDRQEIISRERVPGFKAWMNY